MDIIKLTPAYKDYLWGGNKLKERYGKVTDCTPCAESWELSFHADGPTRTEDGRMLSEVLSPADLGTNVADFPFFPVLSARNFIVCKYSCSTSVKVFCWYFRYSLIAFSIACS